MPTLPHSHRHRARKAALSAVVLGTLAACGGGSDDARQGLLESRGPADGCSALMGKTLAARDIGLPSSGAVVDGAQLIRATDEGNTLGDYCRATGAVKPVDPSAPDLRFAINMPLTWNQRILQNGGGGYSGVLPAAAGNISIAGNSASPLSIGYVTYGSDSGHQTTGASFASNDEALLNYAHQHIKKTHDVAVRVVDWFYGNDRIEKSYFAGTSTGGREALAAAERYPEDFDAVYSSSPVMFWGIRMIGLPLGRLVYGAPGAFLPPAKQTLVTQTSLQACDALDGVEDDIVSNIAACQALADDIVARLRCPGGTDTGDTCLSDAQLSVVKLLHDGIELPYTMASGLTRYHGYNILAGTPFADTAFNLGVSPTLAPTPTFSANAGHGYLFAQAVEWLRYFVARDANFDPLGLNIFEPGPYQQRIVELSSMVGAYSSDLSAFHKRGGKILLMQGLDDAAVSPAGTIDYHRRLVDKMGAATVNEFVRFYQVPGLGHGNGNFRPTWDVLGALDAWATNGTTPGTLVGTDTAPATAGRTRPMCLYPSWPRYTGGDANVAASYRCVTN